MIYDIQGSLSGDPDLSARNDELLANGPLTPAEVYSVFQAVDRNGDNVLCAKLPDGWTSGNTDNKAGFLNLTDNKILS
jgi:hypothetical protein